VAKRILVADDDFDLRTIVSDFLTSEGFEVILAVDGEEALNKAKAEKPDLLVLDLSMPKMNGWDVARNIRKDPALCRIPIIAFTAHALKGAEANAREAGCNAYVAKPFSPEALVDKIRELLR
jgi:two-component system, cell cycle response regulator DivK